MRKLLLGLLVLFLFTTKSVSQQPQSARRNSPTAPTTREIAKKALQAVVVIVTQDSEGKPLTLGSGFQVRPGIVATNYHVIRDAKSARAKFQDGISYWIGRIVAVDKKNDLVLLRLSSYANKDGVLNLASGSVEIGDTAYAVGNPKGLEGTFSQGIVSALRGTDYIQITAPISPGSSGGPVLNKYGEVIGVAVGAIDEGQNLNFAIPVSKLIELLNLTNDTGASDWQFVFSSGGEEIYLSRARIRLTREHTSIAWLKRVPDDSPQGRASRKNTIDFLGLEKTDRSYSFSYSLERWEFDCGHRRTRDLLDTAYYDQEGNLLYHKDPTEFDQKTRAILLQWQAVYSDPSPSPYELPTTSEEEFNFVCKR
jgi:hypothetical protein